MSNTALSLCKFRATLPIFSQLIASSILLGVLSGITATANAQTTYQVNLAREAEAKQSIGVLNRAQQAFYLEKGEFASTIEMLAVGIEESQNYFLGIYPQTDPTQSAFMIAKPYTAGLKGYISGVFLTEVNGEAITIAGICETIEPGFLPGVPKLNENGSELIECPVGYQLLTP